MNAIVALQRHHDKLRVAELERARRLLARGAPAEQVIGQFARRLTNKLLHAPMQALNQAGAAERAELQSLLHRVYQLPDTQGSITQSSPIQDRVSALA